MGNKDVITKQYMSNNYVFADVFNYYVYNGEDKIKPNNLHELDTNEIVSLFSDNVKDTLSYNRDILKSLIMKKDDSFVYLILGIENQSYIDYAIPIRNALYDALQYNKQVKNKTIKSDVSSEEFLSHFRKEDKIIPVITLVMYFGTKKWDGPLSLHEMFSIKDSRALKCIPNYKINLFDPYNMSYEDLNKLRSDIKQVSEFIMYSNDKHKLKKILEEDEAFKTMKADTVRMINEITNVKIKVEKGKERVNMCIAIDEMIKDSENIGIARGIAIGQKEGIAIGQKEGIARGMTIGKEKATIELLSNLITSGLISISDAARVTNISEDKLKEKLSNTQLS